MAYNTNIIPGRPPLLWSDVNEAFVLINENFDIIAASLGPGIVPINFETLDTSVKPTTDNLYELGDITRRWRAVYVGEHTPFDIDNGVWLGAAQIKGVGTTTNLPAGSTIGGDPLTGIGADLIIDPNKTFFKEIQVNNELSLVATVFGDTVNLLSSTGIGLAVNSGADSITVSNTGIVGVVAGPGISSVTAGGIATVANTGVLGLTNTGAIGARTAGLGIHVSSATGTPLITNTGVISVAQGAGITVSLDAALGEVTITNTAPPPNAFTQIQINGDVPNRLVADAAADVLSINSGQGITLTKNTSTDTFEITVDPVFDLRGSIFADDSTVMVDAVNNQLFAINGIFGDVTGNVAGNVTGDILGNVTGNVVGNVVGNVTGNLTGDTTGYHTGDVTGSVFSDGSTLLVDGIDGKIVGDVETARLRTSESAIALGGAAGATSQGNNAVAIGQNAGLISQGSSSVAIGYLAGEDTQGIRAVAIGQYAGDTSQGADAVAIGAQAGETTQGGDAVAIGGYAGNITQGVGAVAVGGNAGRTSQGFVAVAVGNASGYINQGAYATAIGGSAGYSGQGESAVAIGYYAGLFNQAANSIVINAAGGTLNNTVANTFVVKPIRNAIGDYFLQYDPSTGEITYNDTLTTISADIIGSVFADDSTILVNASDGSFSYIPVTPGDWDGAAPTTVGEAIDRLATLVKALNAGTGA